METELSSEMSCVFNSLTVDKLPKKKMVLVNLSHAVFSLLLTHDDLAMQAFVWLHVVLRGTVQFRA
jgi:hypothetical protein